MQGHWATYDFVDGANCGHGLEIVSAEACKAAADALGIAYNKESINGKWTHTPPGCFVHKDCTQGCRLHFGNGNAQALTTEAPTTEAPTTEAPTTEALTTEVPTTNDRTHNGGTDNGGTYNGGTHNGGTHNAGNL